MAGDVKRDWTDARAKVDVSGCRLWMNHHLDCAGRLEAAHVIGRKHDVGGWVNPDSIVPLCTVHHVEYDGHRVDLLGLLTVDEQVQAVRDAGGIESARRRVIGRRHFEAVA